MIEYINNKFIWRPTTTKGMGQVYADIELINQDDIVLARNYHIGEDEIKKMPIRALVDTGAQFMCINENIQEVLRLPFIDKRRVQLADGKIVTCDVVGPVEIKFVNRSSTCKAMILPGDAEPLLGILPLEEMDVIIDPKRIQVIVNPKNPEDSMTWF